MVIQRKRTVQKTSSINIRVNEKITAPEVRIIDAEGNQLGIMSVEDAIDRAEDVGLDLVEVSGKSNPPVCRIMDFGKYKYQFQKKQQEAKKKQTVIKIKEIKLRPRTDKHDLQFKIAHAKQFLLDGNKVKVTVQYRGRELAYTYLGITLLEQFKELLKDVSEVETAPKAEGKTTQMILAPSKL